MTPVADLPHAIMVVADAETCAGFKLAGVRDTFAHTGREAEKALEQIIDRQDAGIVIVNERLVNEMDWRLKKKIDRLARPVVIAVPDKHGPMEETESLRALIVRALGFELKTDNSQE